MFRKFGMKAGLLLVALVLAAITAETPYALDRDKERLGAGAILGEPTGISVKYWLDKDSAVDGAASWSLLDSGGLGFHADYLYHFNEIIKTRDFTIPIYIGVGGRVVIISAIGAGVRIPLGATYLFPQYPLDVFLEIVPGINLLPTPTFAGGGGIGIRYYFRM